MSDLTSRELTEKIAQCMLEKQARDVIALDLEELSTLCDAFVICTGAVDVHVKAIVDHIMKSLDALPEKIRARSVEGYGSLSWVLLDYADVVVHVLTPRARAYYQLERLWGDADITRFHDNDIS